MLIIFIEVIIIAMITRKREHLIQIFLFLLVLSLSAAACGFPGVLPAPSATPSPFPHTATPSYTIAPTATASPTATITPTPSKTPWPTSTPTYAILRGVVQPAQVNCRYGPGAMYIYKYGLREGNMLEVIGRNEPGSWILVQAIGGNNPCWMNAELMEIRGDVMTLAPADPHIIMAWSPYYNSLTGVSAVRDGDQVTISWHPLVLRAGDDAEQTPYVVEAWLCQGGQLVFTPFGAYQTQLVVSDEPGCAEPSYVRVMGAEKHGYTPWIKIDLPPRE